MISAIFSGLWALCAFTSAKRTASMPAAHARASAPVEKLAYRETSPILT